MRARRTLDIYGVNLHLATTERDWKWLRRHLPYVKEMPDSAGHSHFAVWEPNNDGLPLPVLALWIRDELNEDPAELIDTCAHEAAHAAGQILSWIGHDFRGDGGVDEPHAYLVGWLTKWLWENASQPRNRADNTHN